jgi:GntR family transcriptional regulator of arabinose operon
MQKTLSTKVPKYLQIAEALKKDVIQGRLSPDDRLPSFAAMRDRFNVTQHTIEKAHTVLEQEGLIRREQGRGVFVEVSGKKSKTGLIGYLDIFHVSTNHIPYFTLLQNGVRQVANQFGKHLVLIDTPQTFTHWDELEGLLICEMGKVNRDDLSKILPVELSVINLLFDDPCYASVQAEDETGISALVQHLVELGHRNIAYMGRLHHPLIRSRHQAYREALLRNGIEPLSEWTFSSDGPGEAYARFGYEMMQQWLSQDWRETECTAILTQNDLMAQGVIKALQENNIDVPREVSVTGFDGVPGSGHDGANEAYLSPLRLSTAKVPLFDIGAIAMKVLLGETDQKPVPGKPLKLPVELVTGESSARCLTRSHDAVRV